VGLSCADCHLPQVTAADGNTFTPHWFASPIKYLDPARAGAFATKFELVTDSEGTLNTCVRCHADGAAARSAKIAALQDAVYAKALEIQGLLVESLKSINEAESDPSADRTQLKLAIASHRTAHLLWENLAVSENSMGFHNAEVSTELDNAELCAEAAIRGAFAAIHGADAPWPPPGADYETPVWYQWVLYWRAHRAAL
jgi:nitrite reductase (cytochrome c-552)